MNNRREFIKKASAGIGAFSIIPTHVLFKKNEIRAADGKLKWVYLFDSKTTKGWRGAQMDSFPEEGWKIENGVLTIIPSGKPRKSIITEKKYSDFELYLEFKLTANANSGVKYFVLEDKYEFDTKGSALGLEYQLLDDTMLNGDQKDNTHKLASLYDLMPSGKTNPNPVGHWNNLRIVAHGEDVEHWLNGDMVLSYSRGSEDFRKRIANSKFKNFKNFGEAKAGHIMLQDHGSEVSFRNIKLKKLY
jgi:hypothetical protein